MINSKKMLQYYLEQDKIAFGYKKRKSPKLFGDEVWKWQIVYRKYEYFYNKSDKSIIDRSMSHLYRFLWHRGSVKLGFSIPINVFGPGLCIVHYGTIVIAEKAMIGRNCRIHEGVTIGATNGTDSAAKIGDNVFIGSGAKIIGEVTIADDIAIGAGSVVTKSFLEPAITIGGVPAKKITEHSSRLNLCKDLFDDVAANGQDIK